MPISFEPAAPVDNRVFEAYGAALARQANMEFGLKASAQAQAAAQHSSELAQNDDHFRAQLQQQAGLESMRENNQANLAFAGMSHQEQMQNARINAEFTQADKLKLEKLNQDAAGWESLHASGDIDDQEYALGLRQLNSNRGPLQAKREAQESRLRDQQYQLVSQQAAHQTAIARSNERFLNSDGPIYHTDPESGQRFFMSGINGQWTPVPREHTANANGAGGIADTLHNSLIHDIEVQMHNEETPRDPLTPKPAWASSPETRQAEFDRRYGQRMDLLQGQRPPNPASEPLMRDIASTIGSIEQTIRQPNRVLGGVDSLLGSVAGVEPAREETRRQLDELAGIRTSLETIVQRNPNPQRMNTVDRRRFETLYARLAAIRAGLQQAPTPTSSLPPVSARPRPPLQVAPPSSSADVPL